MLSDIVKQWTLLLCRFLFPFTFSHCLTKCDIQYHWDLICMLYYCFGLVLLWSFDWLISLWVEYFCFASYKLSHGNRWFWVGGNPFTSTNNTFYACVRMLFSVLYFHFKRQAFVNFAAPFNFNQFRRAVYVEIKYLWDFKLKADLKFKRLVPIIIHIVDQTYFTTEEK